MPTKEAALNGFKPIGFFLDWTFKSWSHLFKIHGLKNNWFWKTMTFKHVFLY